MRRKHTWPPILLMLAGLWGCSEPAPDFPADRLSSPRALERGRGLFVEHCALCHGEAGDGHGVRRSALSTQPADFTDPVWHRSRTAGEVYRILREGKPGTAMPAWKALPDDELQDLTAYVMSLAGSQGAG